MLCKKLIISFHQERKEICFNIGINGYGLLITVLDRVELPLKELFCHLQVFLNPILHLIGAIWVHQQHPFLNQLHLTVVVYDWLYCIWNTAVYTT